MDALVSLGDCPVLEFPDLLFCCFELYGFITVYLPESIYSDLRSLCFSLVKAHLDSFINPNLKYFVRVDNWPNLIATGLFGSSSIKQAQYELCKGLDISYVYLFSYLPSTHAV